MNARQEPYLVKGRVMSMSNKIEKKITAKLKNRNRNLNGKVKRPMKKFHKEIHDTQSARDRNPPAIRKRRMTSQRKGCSSMQPEEKRKMQRDLETKKPRDSGNPAKTTQPRFPKLQQATIDSSRSGTRKQKQDESVHGNTDSAWIHDIMSDVTEGRNRTQPNMTGSATNPRHNIHAEKMREMNSKSNPRIAIMKNPKPARSIRKSAKNWETKNLEKFVGKKRNLKLEMGRGNEHGTSE